MYGPPVPPLDPRLLSEFELSSFYCICILGESFRIVPEFRIWGLSSHPKISAPKSLIQAKFSCFVIFHGICSEQSNPLYP